jgi:hypothetical protein
MNANQVLSSPFLKGKMETTISMDQQMVIISLRLISRENLMSFSDTKYLHTAFFRGYSSTPSFLQHPPAASLLYIFS